MTVLITDRTKLLSPLRGGAADISDPLANVRYWHIADVELELPMSAYGCKAEVTRR
jgi:hypothetical protein